LRRIIALRGPKKAREWLGLSLSEVGCEIARLTGRERPFDKRTVSGWEHGKPLSAAVRNAFGVLLANQLTARLGRVVGVRMESNSPWRVTAWAQCRECRTWFHLRRAKQTRCEACRRR